MNILTQNDLKRLLEYNPITGVFVRRISLGGGAKEGDVAGGLSHGYISISLRNKRYLAHRLAWLYMTGSWPKKQIDHINRIRNDNRWCNLRECNVSENSTNSKNRNNINGYKGLSFLKRSNKWIARITKNKKTYHIGTFSCKEDAAAAYNMAALKYHGDFACYNKIR